MRGINRVFLMGHLGHDPVLRQTPNGRTVTDLNLAVNRSVRAGEGWAEEADWIRVRLWEQKAELASRFLSKGSAIAVEGQIRTESWMDKEGARQHKVYVTVDQLHLLPGRRGPEASAGEDLAPPPAVAGLDPAEIPF